MKNIKNLFKKMNEKGITLIVLVVTVIVLLILAAVALATLQDKGVINLSQTAKQNYEAATSEEVETLTNIGSMLPATPKTLSNGTYTVCNNRYNGQPTTLEIVGDKIYLNNMGSSTTEVENRTYTYRIMGEEVQIKVDSSGSTSGSVTADGWETYGSYVELPSGKAFMSFRDYFIPLSDGLVASATGITGTFTGVYSGYSSGSYYSETVWATLRADKSISLGSGSGAGSDGSDDSGSGSYGSDDSGSGSGSGSDGYDLYENVIVIWDDSDKQEVWCWGRLEYDSNNVVTAVQIHFDRDTFRLTRTNDGE